MTKDPSELEPPSSESREAGYETSDISIRRLAIFVVCLIVLAVAIHAGAWLQFAREVSAGQKTDRAPSALSDLAYIDEYNRRRGAAAGLTVLPRPPAPQLQPSPNLQEQHVPADDLREMYQRENVVFAKMGWTIDPNDHNRMIIPSHVMDAVVRNEGLSAKIATTRPGNISR